MQARTVDITITSLKKQDITLIARHGMENIKVSAGVLAESFQPGKANIDLHLPENEPVEINVEIGDHDPTEWCTQVG